MRVKRFPAAAPEGSSKGGMPVVRLAAACALAIGVALVLPAAASAHLERPSYWPDPRPDTSVTPPAGGEVPKARSFRSAVTGRGRGEVRVVCQGREGRASMRWLRRSVRVARTKGFWIRPSQGLIRYSARKARIQRRLNRRLARQCSYRSIQQAVFDSRNNDRIVIMPGRYTENRARRQPVNDPRCDPELLQRDQQGRLAPSYRYQVTCPNDQNLIYVQGRALTDEPPPEPPLADRKGLPDAGPCVRCNLQIEGSGVKPRDVIIDAGRGYTHPRRAQNQPAGHAKDVVLRVDRADGFVGRNFTMRGAEEHGFYTEETAGVLLSRVGFYWNFDYGHLSFVTDHHVVQGCDGMGTGDAVVYPGASPETGEQASTDFWPDAPRPNTVIRRCDLRGSLLGYSGSQGNAVRITNNHIYGNAAGIASDSFSIAGHPGFPADSIQIDNNLIYSNNFNVFAPDSPVPPAIGIIPVGTGVWLPGHNNARVHDNWIFDNWRQGTQLIGVPDALLDEPEGQTENPDQISCETATLPEPISTSCGNRQFNNVMGLAPPGFGRSQAMWRFEVPHGGPGRVQPNGVDFYWDERATNTGNCWFGNTGPDGTEGSITVAAGAPPDPLPADCATSVGLGDSVKDAELVNCFLAREEDADALGCTWGETPPRPASAAARAAAREHRREAREYVRSERGQRAAERIRETLERHGVRR